ncbi:MAG: transferrin receptor-like dimerization domain-containing protein [Pseudomonadales bacterium]|jgi:N-acetylated-alpha-linked acidic dipeptidase
MMKYSYSVCTALLFTCCITSTTASELIGFTSDESRVQRNLEAAYDKQLDASQQDRWLKQFSAKPHHVGSRAGKENAEIIARLFKSWGYKTEIAEYQILLPTPKERLLELVAPTKFTASLSEDMLEEDASTSVRDELLPPYNAFSIDGDVEAELVFINYGRPEDHDLLERYGIDLTGKIAIAKYGKSWRGIKPKLAAEKGAIATIIYSDPADDGYGRGDVYPSGPFKHESGVQRGSVMDMPTYPGDVLTPGVGATKRAKRLKIEDAVTITQIPVLPISYKDALPLLAAMGGANVPKEWVGGLPITYHLGPGPARVRMKLEFNWDMVVAYNVIARLKGSQYPNEWVIRGNHHDGWNHGAADPLSGLVALMDEAKSVASLAREGHPPLRTIVYGIWDAEEPGLIGSTEWVEHHRKELDKRTVAYINTDGNSRGFVQIGGSHSLEKFYNQIMADVKDPQTGVSVKERRTASIKINGNAKAKAEAAKRDDIRLYPLGSGSDYTPFLQHLGIASANISFSGEGAGGSYHTLYDTYEHYTKWRDPGLAYGVALAQVAGRATLRLANATILPFTFTSLADNISMYVDELVELAESQRKEAEVNNQLISDGIYELALDPTKSLGPPPRKEPVPYFSFAPLKNALDRLQAAAKQLDDLTSKEMSSNEKYNDKNKGLAGSKKSIAALNKLLYSSERRLLLQQGLEGRNWFKHHIYAPGYYTGYGVKTIPGVREAIEIGAYGKVPAQIDTAAMVLDSLSRHLEEASGLFDK